MGFRGLSSLGLPPWFRHAYFEYHAHVRLRLKLAAGLGEPRTRNDVECGFVFVLVLVSSWSGGFETHWYADNLKCVSRELAVLLRAAGFTTTSVKLVGQEPAPSKCVLRSTSRVVRKDMRDWVLTHEDDRWTVKLDVRDLCGHLDATFRGWSATLASRVKLVISRLVLNLCCSAGFSLEASSYSVHVYPGSSLWKEGSFLAMSV